LTVELKKLKNSISLDTIWGLGCNSYEQVSNCNVRYWGKGINVAKEIRSRIEIENKIVQYEFELKESKTGENREWASTKECKKPRPWQGVAELYPTEI
jgi:hypothetical protein